MSIQPPEAYHPAINCPECGRAVPAGADECPACYQPLCMACGAAVGRYWPRCRKCGTERELLCPTCHAPIRPRDRHCRQCGSALLHPATATPDPPLTPPQPAPQAAADPWASAVPACQVCGRQDETLRLVGLPYVFSLVLITFRRAFAGVWCARHRRLRCLLAGAITAMVGWIGIPFGFIYTPLALLKLARGGEQPADQNVRLLQALADHRLRSGDAPGARRCLEEVLRVCDNEATRGRLRAHDAQYGPPAVSSTRTLRPIVFALAMAVVTGLVIGVCDVAITALLSRLLGGLDNILFVILSWTPWIAMLFLGGLIVSWLIEGALATVRCRSMPFALVFAFLVALVALYGTQQGTMAGFYVSDLVAGWESPPALLDLPYLLFGFTVGGGMALWDDLQSGATSDIIYGVVFAVAVVYYGFVAWSAARRTTRWQQALREVSPDSSPIRRAPLRSGWVAIVAMVACIGCSFLSVPLAYMGGAFEGFELIDQATEHLAEDDLDSAVAALETAVAESPGLGMGHSFLGSAYLGAGRLDEAIRELEEGARLQPDVAPAQAYLALAYYYADRVADMEEALARAEALRGDDLLANRTLCSVYLQMNDLDRAEVCCERAVELHPDDPSAYDALATLYSLQGRHDEALSASDRSLALDPELADAYMIRGYALVRREDLDGAWEAVSRAREMDPDSSSTHAACSYVHYLRGEVDEALAAAEEAVRLDPYDSSAQRDLAMACHAAGDLDCGLAAAAEAIRLQPKQDTAYYTLGLCYRDLGRVDEAVQAFEMFLDLYWDRAYTREWKADAEAYLATQR